MKRFLKIFGITFVILVGALLFTLSHQIGGWRAFIITSASMEPTIATGSLIITRVTAPNALQKNDIITFIPPLKHREFVTHRIVEITQKNHVTTLKTKGDNNKNEDPWIVAGGGVVGEIMYSIPLLGYLFSFTQTKLGILFFILLPSTYIIVDEIFSCVSTIRQHKKTTVTPKIAVIYFFLFLGSSYHAPPSTHSLLADSATIASNEFSVMIDQTSITPTPNQACRDDSKPTERTENRSKS